MLNKMKRRLKEFLVSHMDLRPLERFVPDINLNCMEDQKRVLIAYVDYFRASRDVAAGALHPNRYELFQIIRCFIQMEYVIDVCACSNEEALEYIANKKYDVIFGMGKVFREAVKQHKEAYSILFLTENPYDVSYQREKERIDYLYERRGIKWEFDRTGSVFERDDEKKADAVICKGETEYLRHVNGPVRRIFSSALVNKDLSHDFAKKRKENFLVLGSAGFVHKGTDLLVEVFEKHPEWQLYLCGYDVSKILKKMGYNSRIANIHDCGYVDVRGKRFQELAEKCVYILLPSCSEGFSTAILTGMAHGMIPIISKGMGMDFMEQYCLFFDGFRLEDIEKEIMQAMEVPMAQLAEKSQEVYRYASREFTLEHFTKNMQDILSGLLKENRDESGAS